MPLSRALKNTMRSAKGPGRISVDSKTNPGPNDGTVKQYKQTGKKYTGPNYPDKDTHIITSGILK